MLNAKRMKLRLVGLLAAGCVALTSVGCANSLGTTECAKWEWYDKRGDVLDFYARAYYDAFYPDQFGFPSQNQLIWQRLVYLEDQVCSRLPPYWEIR